MEYIEKYVVDKWIVGVLAVMDTNKNFDILSGDMTNGWKSLLWREIINDPGLTQIRFSDFESGQIIYVPNKSSVNETSKEGKHFKSNMPFSWIIYRELSFLWKTLTNIPLPDEQGIPFHFRVQT